MQDKPTFTGGNKSFGAALNKTVESLWRHGLNPAGMPGWSESADGWVPPVQFEGGETTILPFDVIKVKPQPEEDGPTIFTLHLPYVRKSNKYDVSELSVPITIEDFEVEAGSWLVAKMLGPIETFIETPEITIEVITEELLEVAWESFPNAHEANPDEPYEWKESRIPLWQFLSEEDKTDTSVLLLTEDDEKNPGQKLKIYGQKFIGTSPQLIYTLALATEDRLRTVPDLI
jgi:hypothetical protein